MWIPPEVKEPVMYNAPTMKQTGYFGAVRPADGTFFSRNSDIFNGKSFEAFLKRLVRRRKKGHCMVLVLDNSRYHHARLLKPFLRRNRRILRLVFLPPYSPDLNPIERVWKLTRRLCVHNRFFPLLRGLVRIVNEKFSTWSAPNESLKRLCAVI